MLSTQDFAHEVWVSLENIRERLAALETEARHTRRHLQRLEERFYSEGFRRPEASPRRSRVDTSGEPDADSAPGATVNLRFNRRTMGNIGGGGAIGGGLLAGALGLGRVMGWW